MQRMHHHATRYDISSGLFVDGKAVSGCLTDFDQFMEDGRPTWEWFQELFDELSLPNKVKQFIVHFRWFHERFSVLPAYAKCKSGTYSVLPFVARLDEMGTYIWGSVALAWLYRCTCRVTNRNVTNLVGPLQLLQFWIFWQFPTLRLYEFDDFSFRWHPGAKNYPILHCIRLIGWSRCKLFVCDLKFHYLFTDMSIVWEPYVELDVLAVVHPEILIEEHNRLWWAVTALIYFAVIEWHKVDRVVLQLGGI
ncbi:hypothetical protein Ahy_A02g006758 [Arachis hypogaea]|uniref:Aminotransferase-like plant mobile domain-containing protein n=1 Tax=Arachis hypogaea TaxID=3818 RepID=A0A445EB68_ARAHY|nr:hypothetical protein Ahy_A02g006758 [Arachis hypogaea]